MSITKDRMKWECMSNHLPDWIEDNDAKFHSIMSDQDLDRIDKILDEYNSLSDMEDNKDIDAFCLFGIDYAKQDLVDEMVKIYEKYKHKNNI